MTTQNTSPMDDQRWRAINRECSLVCHLIGSGVTALGKANYADKKGDYYTAFFGLSVGLERLAKLILVADYAIQNNGKLPEQKVIRKYGHNLVKLLNKCHEIADANNLELDFPRPNDALSNSIVTALNSFADASQGRYANFDSLGDPDLQGEFEPISNWWTNVAEPVLEKHFYGKPIEQKVRANAFAINQLMGDISMVHHIDENDRQMTELETASIRSGQTPVVQKYGRFYTLKIVRWLSSIFMELSRQGGYSLRIETLFGHYEHFFTFTVEDRFLRDRKVWPLNKL